MTELNRDRAALIMILRAFLLALDSDDDDAEDDAAAFLALYRADAKKGLMGSTADARTLITRHQRPGVLIKRGGIR